MTQAYNSDGIIQGLAGKEGTGFYTDFRGIPVMGAFRWLPGLQATLMVEVSESEALAASIEAQEANIIVVIAAVIAASILGTLVVRQIVRPIEQLSQTARAIGAGHLAARAVIKGSDEITLLAQSFNAMTGQLQNLIQTLEDRVTERVRDLTLASDVSRQITTELDSEKLLSTVAELTASAFGLYHVSIFLHDDADKILVLHQGSGETGQNMLTAGRLFSLDHQGLVPTAARTRQPTLSNNVHDDPSHLTNPFLPHTQSELAVPIVYLGQLIGVLDLQARTVNRFREEDIRLMTTLAEQIAIAVQNAQLFHALQGALEATERANAVKSSFLASMSHELRTPLNAIINFTKFLLKGKMGTINERQLDALDKVKTSGIHLLNLINDVLDISKIESGSLTLLVEEDVDVTSLIEKAVSTGRALLEEKPVEIRVDIAPDLQLILGDKQRLLQVLLNIVSNACKFTEQGHIQLRAYQQSGQVFISVEDTGPGIPLHEHAAVFEAFKQTETGLRKGSGTGLGMPISKHLVEAHGGHLLLQSEPGQGTTMTVILPVRSATLELNLI